MGIDKHFLQVKHILLQTIRHLLNLDELMAVVFVEHALHANCNTALFAKILDGFVRVAGAKNICLSTFYRVGKEKHFRREHVLSSLYNRDNLLVFDKLPWISGLYYSLASGATFVLLS